jgi:hypothetical protein
MSAPGALILTESNVSPVLFDENQTQVDLDVASTPQVSGPIQSTDHQK